MHSSPVRRLIARSLGGHHSPFRIPLRHARRGLHHAHAPTPPSLLRNQQATALSSRSRISTSLPGFQRRFSSGHDAESKPLTDEQTKSAETLAQDAEAIAERKAQEPAYEMTFTCRRCMHRSSHRITKQAYHYGTTLITCPGCKNRHLISDNLKIFTDKNTTIEDIMREKGQFITKGVLGEDGEVEFLDEEAVPEDMKEHVRTEMLRSGPS